ncbi:hypothetical protein BFP70_16210 [Thioclava sp. SK-1]|uniref:hypothetical protein n=1 Tax=Thioclava sp. SK-1 TaxID=1889770 RepID=UPI0008257AAB|nr:hypothetical protein [Thioclava sp. SK-1]OCX61006.1 hypothetical protein BFP70_16210 [Thioclava sp. SK-1]
MNILALIAPVVLPSWGFFSEVGPSPRIEYRWLDRGDDWREFRPRPARLGLGRYLLRLVWNPDWNESLYLVSLSERLVDHPTAHSIAELERYMRHHLRPETGNDIGRGPSMVQFRLAFWSREGAALVKDVYYESAPIRV